MGTIYLAGGCFWGLQKFFDQFSGVIRTEVGYANGPDKAPSYQEVCRNSGHAETVRVDYNDEVMNLEELLDYYFMVIDPLSVNRQGNDIGIQYRTGMYQFVTGEISVSKMKNVDVEDLLGRDPVKADMTGVFKELEQMNQAVVKEAEGDATFAKLAKADNVYTDMVANDTVTGNSIVVKLVKIGLADVIGSDEERNALLTDALYAEAEAAGLTKLQKTTTEAKFLGKDVTAIGVKGDLALSDEYTTEMWYQMISKQKGQYASVIFVTGFSEFGGDNFQEILDKFETLE